MKPGKLRKHLILPRIHRDFGTACDDLCAHSCQELPAHQQRERLHPCIQRRMNHLGPFCDKDAIFRPLTGSQLRIRKMGEKPFARLAQAGKLDNGHGAGLLWIINTKTGAAPFEKLRRSRMKPYFWTRWTAKPATSSLR